MLYKQNMTQTFQGEFERLFRKKYFDNLFEAGHGEW